jgi:3-hydroxyisobutyrate dehydrogenase
MNRTSAKSQKRPAPVNATAQRSIKTTKKTLTKTTKKTLTKTSKRAFSASAEDKVIGVIGLGNMGGHMAHNLLKKGHNIVVYDVFQPNVDTAVANGQTANKNVKVATSPYEVAMNSDVVITMLPKTPHVMETYTGAKGLLSAIKDRKAQGKSKLLLIDSSTIAPLATKEIHALVGNDADVLDAPVSGGVMGAENGTLTFMVGADADQFELAKPVLSKMGKNIVLCGPTGSGQAAKVCNNLILGISMNAIAEGYNLGVKRSLLGF